METDDESNAKGVTQRDSQTVMWQLRKTHIPKRQNTSKQPIAKEKVPHNQTSIHSKPKNKNRHQNNA
jgi:hypothetical protein